MSFALLFVCLTGCRETSGTHSSKYPQRPIKLIVPFAAGGGSDTFARIIQKAIDDNTLLPQPLVIINVSGAGGTVGSRRVKNARPDGYTLLLLHEGIITSRNAGQASYGPEAFAPIAGTGRTGMTICVAEDSPYESLKELVEAAAETPDLLLFSCSLGSPSHFAGLMIENAAPGSQFRYVQSGGGAKRFAGIQGGHADVTALSLAEFINFKDSGLRALALLGPERDPDAPDLKTAAEQGFDVISSNMQFWWAPKGTPPDRLEYISDVLKRAMQTPEVTRRLAQLKIEPIILEAEALQADLADRSQRIQRVSQRPMIALPNFPMLTLAAVGILSLFVIGNALLSHQVSEAESTDDAVAVSDDHRQWNLTLVVVALTCVYVAAMQFELIGYRLATLGYVIATGLMLVKQTRKEGVTVVGLAIALSFGLHYVFTQLFVIDLP